MDSEKFNAVLGYFNDLRINLPTEVKNSLEDVFQENDNIESVEVYHPEDRDAFQSDLKLFNDVTLSMAGTNEGSIMNVWTYYGDVQFSLTEKTVLLDENGELLETISDLDNSDTPSILNSSEDFAIILLEKTQWKSSEKERKFERHPCLYIYCPFSDNVEENIKEEKFNDVYNRLSDSNGSLSL